MYRRLFLAFVAIAYIAGCGSFGRSGGAPQIVTKLCGVQIDGKTRETHLRIVLAMSRVPRDALLEVEFENPTNEKAPLVTRRLTGNESTIEVLSPPVAKLQARVYNVTARVYATAQKKELIATHTQRCESLVDEHDVLH